MFSFLKAAWRRCKFGAAALLLYTAMSVAVMAPFSPREVPSTAAQDLCNHVSGIIEARRALAEGQFPIRVAPDQNQQTRYPIFQFYGNLPYSLGGAAYRLSRSNPYTIWKWEVTAFLVLGAFFTYRCGRVLTRQPLAALSGGAVFLTAPYVLTDIHGRFAFTELASFMLLPAVFYWSWRCFAARGLGPILASGIAWSALALSHNVSYLYAATYFGLFFASWLAPRRKPLVRCFRVGAGFALGLVLTAWSIVPQQMLVPDLRSGLIANVGHNNWLTPLGVLLAPGVSLPVHLPTIYIGAPEHFGLQVGWPILAGVGLSLCYLRGPLARMHGQRALMARFLVLFGLALFMVWSPLDFWRLLPSLFYYVQFSYRLLMFVVLWGSLLAVYALARALEARMRPVHLAAIVLGLGWSASPYMKPHQGDPSVTLAQEIAHPEMGRGGAGGAYLISGLRLTDTTLAHPDMNWASPANGGVLDGMEFHNAGRLRAVLPATQVGDELLLRGTVADDAQTNLRLLITVDDAVVAQPELPPGPFELRIPLPPAPDKARVHVVVEGKPMVVPAPAPYHQPFLKSSYQLAELSLAPRSDRPETPRLLPAEAVRGQVQFGHPTTLRLKITEPSLVQLPVIYYPHVLRVHVDGQPTVVRHLGCFVAVELPAGEHSVTVWFAGVRWADRVSLVGWLGVAVGGLGVAVRRQRRLPGPPQAVAVTWTRVFVGHFSRAKPQAAQAPAAVEG